jgi:excinuclease ABC subunit C
MFEIDKQYLNTLSTRPGVYRFLDAEHNLLYVGKANNLKQRVGSYFATSKLTLRIQHLMAQVAYIETTITQTETEALLLEYNFIKQYQPKYNILLRDDKSYPYIFLSQHEFPRLGYQRGKKKINTNYFGPYPHVQAVHESLELLYKIFKLRTCNDITFSHRTRPCLQYQIKRCTAPCVGLVSVEIYQQQVKHAILFLEGKNQEIVQQLIMQMQQAATNLAFEQAAQYRDQINALRLVQTKQTVATKSGDVDIIACVVDKHLSCVYILRIRAGQQIGGQSFFPTHQGSVEATEILTAFLSQYYLQTKLDLPQEIITNHALGDMQALIDALAERKKLKFSSQVRGMRANWLIAAVDNANQQLRQHQPSQYRHRLADLCQKLGLEALPLRLECFDISHTQGEATTAACVVFDQAGPAHSEYRRFNLDLTTIDDYAAMRMALLRRFKHNLQVLPDILFIDGGRGQVNIAQQVLISLNLDHKIKLIGIAKGARRSPGLEKLILTDTDKPLILNADAPGLHLVLHIRDEAHRFALLGHQGRRAKIKLSSTLENISGIGAKRRQNLLQHFAGLHGVMRASVEELAAVPGISKQLAQRIYNFLH